MTDVNPLTVMIDKWTDDGNPENAIFAMDKHGFNLMVQYPDGVPVIVITTALERGLDFMGQFLAGMIVDTKAKAEGWTDEEQGTQVYLARMAMRMLRGEAWIDALNEYMPPDALVPEGGETEE